MGLPNRESPIGLGWGFLDCVVTLVFLSRSVQSWGRNVHGKPIYFAEKFIESLLANISQPVEIKNAIFPFPSSVIYQLKRLQLQVKERSGEVQGLAGFGLNSLE